MLFQALFWNFVVINNMSSRASHRVNLKDLKVENDENYVDLDEK